MNIILWVLFGAITAWVATIIIGEPAQRQTKRYITVGVVGAIIAGSAMQLLTKHAQYDLNYYSLIVSVGGALCFVALLTYGLLSHRRH